MKVVRRMEENKSDLKFGDLRIRAEESLREKFPQGPESLAALSPAEVRRLLHELRVYQTELEMQNEELRRAQLELEASRAQYFDLYDLAPIGYVTLDQQGLIEKANLTAARLLGLERELLIGEPLTRFIAREEQDSYYLCRKELLKMDGRQACEMRMNKKGGARFWARLEMAVADVSAGEAPSCRVVLMEITDRKQAEELLKKAHLQLEQKVRERTLELEMANAELKVRISERKQAVQTLRESEAHFRSMVEILPIAIFGHTERGISFANTAAADLLEVKTPRALLGKNLAEFLNEDEQDLFARHLKDVLVERVGKQSLVARLVSSSSAAIDVEMFLTPSIDQGDPAVQITAYNLTERKKIEEEMVKADKLESISILAGGIAHDFNNYLATVLGNITLAIIQKDKPETVYKYLANMEQATHRVKFLTNQLFAFAKGGAPCKKTVLMNKLITDSTNFALTGSGTRCQLSLAKNLHAVDIDEGQITQVLYNIIINAMQAMPEGGTIRLKGENFTIGEVNKNQHLPLPDGEYVQISIQDDGSGIPDELLSKIFDPFFSTKQKGSGLGLATSYSIIKSHDGYIEVESQKGKGTTFSIFLPASTQTALPDTKEDEIIYGTGRILVVDDQADIREVMGKMLSNLGYEAHFAKDGAEAIEMYRDAKNQQRPFDLLVMDLTIPGGMGGKETIDRLRKEDNTVKAVVSSGYSEEPVMANYEEYGFNGVIKKPYTINEVSRAIHKAMKKI